MFKNIDEALNWVMARRNTGHTFDKFKAVCEKLNNPQDDFYTIHVTGTDGKGSTVTYLRDLLMAHGYKVGTLQSPHYITHLDRIRVNNENITAEAFLSILNKNYDFYIENDLSMFEIDYLIMCEYFKMCQIDMAIIEVGIGGRLDATNVLNNTKLSIITTIGYDHMELLGDSLPLICYEKCGIIKDNSKVLIGDLDDECVDVVIDQANKHNSEVYRLDKYIDLGERKFVYRNKQYELASYAKYQIHNACLALSALEIISKDYYFEIIDSKVKQALSKTIWPNRFEVVKENPRVILDGAHNIHGVSELVKSFDQFSGSKCIIFSALKRKEYLKMLEVLKKHCDELVITTFNNYEVIDLSEFDGYKVNKDYKDAINEAMKKYDNILICGSLYFLSDVVLNVKF